MSEILFLQPKFQERIWGGTRLRDHFGYDIPSEQTGECWAISAHANGDCQISNGTYEGKTLSWLWENHRELFGNISGDRFPLLTKILDAKDDLSVQVHPGDDYAKEFENGELGKTECWYIIDCEEDAELIIGHHAKSKEEMTDMIASGNWQQLLRKVKIKPGDFFFIPAGTIHAIGKGTMILETQQSSDVTYRVYDYDRLQDGKPRELHIEKSIAVSTVPHEDYSNSYKVHTMEQAEVTRLVESKYFTVYKTEISGKQLFRNSHPFVLVSVLEGTGKIDGVAIDKGQHFIIPSGYEQYTIEGNVKLIVSHI
ncbi:mannose-6-phosphate isomerase, class I [Bacillus sp. HMF5848]|nr:mannose-6-phosphate isomerase, class I [Bacillus sp. HMF5848]RSK28335.1 mannose-6-phosphate isomerase, class I [Bacillus sp. HMF5848]